MPAISEFRLGDYGQSLLLTVTEDGTAVNIAAATSIKVILRTPRNERIEKTGTFYTDGTDGIIKYTFTKSDLNQMRPDFVGQWRAAASFTLGTWIGSSSPISFDVCAAL